MTLFKQKGISKRALIELTEFNVSGTQNMACKEAWFTMYLTASGPAEKQNLIEVTKS